ncbi:MAG: ABC transporter permease [Anaerolineaceae bacterium]|nr:ABC transporter permease [Anaerolineaceae bacterium]
MNLLESIRLALVGLTVNKLRTFLTMLGIIIGVAAVITLISVGRGVEAVVIQEFQGLGNNLLFVFPGDIDPSDPRPARAGGAGLTLSDAVALSDPFRVPDLLGVVPSYDRPAIVSRGGQETRTTISGTNTQFPLVRNFYPALGTFFTEQDVASGSRVAVIGQSVYDELFEAGEFPIGEDIRINNVNFRIIGMLEEKGGSGFNDQDDVVLVPVTTAQQRLFPARRADGELRIDVIYAQVVSEERQDAAIIQMEAVLREEHNITFRDEDDFTILSQSELLGAFGEITGVLTIFLGVIAGISLLVGGIGIMNIMLVSVTERTREIGLRKAVGAKYRDILTQFLVEAVVIASVGGLIGLALGAVGAAVISDLSPLLDPALDWNSVALAIGFSAGVGLFFGLYPATRAARLNPIDALRYE